MRHDKARKHAALDNLPTLDDCYVFAGKPLTDIAAAVGRTPFYAYDRSAMTARVRRLRETLPGAIKLHYAIKANPMPAVVEHMATLVDGLDVASAKELEIALRTSVVPRDVSFAGPGKLPTELAAAIAAGICINVESEHELETIARLAEASGKRPHVAVRVNPDFELKTSGMRMSGGAKQFGVDAERVPKMLERIGALDLDFVGLHIFCGSQNLSARAICEAQSKSIELAIELSKHAPGPTRVVNIGGGFGIPYFPGDEPLDLQPIADNLEDLLAAVNREMPTADLVIELGRYLVGEAGIYVCEVVDRKVSRGHVFLVTNGGLHHHLAASGNFGQVIRKNYPVVLANRVRGGEREIVSVVGPLCTPLDLLADRVELGRADPGDLVVVLQSGAYGLTASPTGFLSHPAPAEIVV
jgi:diaminopimelate decarboxylase